MTEVVTDKTALLKAALHEMRYLRAEVRRLEKIGRGAVAIVGMGCRFPGSGHSPAEFWEFLRAGRSAIREIPPERWDLDVYFDEIPGTPGKMYTKYGGLLDRIDTFDAAFFGIPKLEAQQMDPQQRLLLEVTRHALEDAGQAPERLRGSKTGIFLGQTMDDYARVLDQNHDPAAWGAYAGLGNSRAVAAGRLAYVFNFRGPTLQLDTTCSSSLVALHLACGSLRAGECNMAIAGGVNLILSPKSHIFFCSIKALSPGRVCRTFDAAADGYVRGEGCGLVVLKRLEDALACGDRIHALIRGSAINHNGFSNGLTAPNAEAQNAVIRAALANAEVDPDTVGYVEAHGTGTRLGDPIEISGLAQAYGSSGTRAEPLVIGSVKTNFGHLEAAAGAAGLIKTVLAIKNRTIPAHLHLEHPNEHIPWQNLPIKVAGRSEPWPNSSEKLLAGVSSFGMSGTNAHIILESPPATTPSQTGRRPLHLFCFSAKEQPTLAVLAEAHAGIVSAHTLSPIQDLCFTANHGRDHFPHRAALLCSSHADLAAQLKDEWVNKYQAPGSKPKTAFLFSGQGLACGDMGATLFHTQDHFRAAIEQCDRVLKDHDFHLIDRVYGDKYDEGAPLWRQAIFQPAIFALEYALAEMWTAWGIRAEAVIGHSLGELAAACHAGILRLEDALVLAAQRGRLMANLPPGGGMATVFASEEIVIERIAPYGDDLVLAAANGPANQVISGPAPLVANAVERFRSEGVSSRVLEVSHAFHTRASRPLAKTLAEHATTMNHALPEIPFYSCCMGDQIEEIQPDYWRRQMTQTVRFRAGLAALARDGFNNFLEIGPATTLTSLGRAGSSDPHSHWYPSLSDNQPNWRRVMETLAGLYRNGAKPDWDAFYRDAGVKKTDLALYPFSPKTYWAELLAASPPDGNAAITAAKEHPLLGSRIPLPGSREIRFHAKIGSGNTAYLEQHQVFGRPVLPAAAYFETLLAAARSGELGKNLRPRRFEITRPMFLNNPTEIQLVFSPKNSGFDFKVYSQQPDRPNDWVCHCRGVLENEPPRNEPPSLPQKPQTDELEPWAIPAFYQSFSEVGLNYGPDFQVVKQLWRSENEAMGIVQMPAPNQNSAYSFHPAILDGCLQICGAALPARAAKKSYLPVGLESLELIGPAAKLVFCHAIIDEARSTGTSLTAELRLFDQDESLIARLRGLRLQASPIALPPEHFQPDYAVEWISSSRRRLTREPAGSRSWFVFSTDEALGEAVLQGLALDDVEATLIDHGEAFESRGERRFRLDPCCLPHLTRLFGRQKGPLGIALLTPLDPGWDPTGNKNLRTALNLTKSLADHGASVRFHIFTRGTCNPTQSGQIFPRHAPLWGLGRTIALEYPTWNCRLIDLDPATSFDPDPIVFELTGEDPETQVAWRKEQRYLARLVRAGGGEHPLTRPDDGSYRLVTSAPGLLENLNLERVPLPEPAADEVLIEIQATGLNFKDVLLAMGMLPPSKDDRETPTFGFECCGHVVARGSRVQNLPMGRLVMAVLCPGSIGSHVAVHQDLVVPVPTGTHAEQAATLPLAFLTAYYGLVELAGLCEGKHVLIHAAAGGVGQAAIQIARAKGAMIYATASRPKWAFLEGQGLEHISDSRSLDFGDQVMAATGGRGVDVVLNGLSGDYIKRGMDVLAAGGCFLEIGKIGIWSRRQAQDYRPDTTYFAYDMGRVAQDEPHKIKAILHILSQGLREKRYQPLPFKRFSLNAAREGFFWLARAKNIGKVVFAVKEQGLPKATPPIDPHLTYLITGGHGALGLQVAERLVAGGVRHLALVGRSFGISEPFQAMEDRLKKSGADIRFFQADVGHRAEVAELLRLIAKEMTTLGGIIHAAGTTADGSLRQMDWVDFHKVLKPKVDGARNLHELTRDQPLQFFVCFSSMASLLGAPGQGNYAAANAFLDALMAHRRRLGLPGISINWGPWSGGGMAAGSEGALSARGIRMLAPETALDHLETVLAGETLPSGRFSVDWPLFTTHLGTAAQLPFWKSLTQAATPKSTANFLDKLKQTPMGERPIYLETWVREQIGNVLGEETAHDLEPRRRLFDLGLDSIMALELKNRLEAGLGCHLPQTLLFDTGTLEALCNHLAETTGVVRLPGKKTPLEPVAASSAPIDLDSLSDEQAEALLVEELEREQVRANR